MDQKYTMGDIESRRNIRAEAEACANDLRHPQNRLQDLRVFEMDIESSSDYMKVITDRTNYFKEIESARVEGVPVTTPVRAARNTHHIVQYNDLDKKRNGNNPDDVVVVQRLYRNYDNYYTAFRLMKRSHNILDPSGWFYFYDAKLPIFLRKNLRGETKAFKLTLPCAYKQLEAVSVGNGSTRAIFMCCSKYTQMPSNYRAITNEREKAVQCNMILMGEGQRFPEVKRAAVKNMANGVLAPLEPDLIKPVNQWSVISDCVFQHLLGISGMLEKVEKMFGWNLRAGGEGECRLSLLVGPEAKISLLNYHDEYARDVIKARQQGQ